MKIIFIFILLLISEVYLYSQTYMLDGSQYNSIEVDSLFEDFVTPDFPSLLFENACSYPDFIAYSFQLFCCVKIDTNGKVSELKLYPLYDLGNTVPDTSYIWKDIIRSIDSVSKYWTYKPIYHKIQNNYSESTKLELADRNNAK